MSYVSLLHVSGIEEIRRYSRANEMSCIKCKYNDRSFGLAWKITIKLAFYEDVEITSYYFCLSNHQKTRRMWYYIAI